MVLKTDVALLRFCFQTWVSQLGLVDQLAVEFDRDLTVEARHDHLVPLSRGPGGVGLRRDPGQDAAANSMSAELRFAGRVYNLDLDDRPYGLLAIGDIEIKAAVTTLLVFVFKLALKVLVFVLQPKVGGVAFPVGFTFTRLQMGDTLFAECPIARRLKMFL